MAVQLEQIEYQIRERLWWVAPHESLDERFPDLRSKHPFAGGYAIPTATLLNSLIWLWLTWHECGDMELIKSMLRPVIERAVAANADPKAVQELRQEHDSFLLQLAILTGSESLITMACGSVQEAEPACDKYQYLQGWTGILKYRILGEGEKIREQYEIMQRWKPNRIFAWPSKKLVETFVERDYKSFHTVLKRSCEKHWQIAEKQNSLHRSKDGPLRLNVKRKDPHFLWPWVEGAFAKLAYRDGARITYDSEWLPLGLVKAVETGHMCHAR